MGFEMEKQQFPSRAGVVGEALRAHQPLYIRPEKEATYDPLIDDMIFKRLESKHKGPNQEISRYVLYLPIRSPDGDIQGVLVIGKRRACKQEGQHEMVPRLSLIDAVFLVVLTGQISAWLATHTTPPQENMQWTPKSKASASGRSTPYGVKMGRGLIGGLVHHELSADFGMEKSHKAASLDERLHALEDLYGKQGGSRRINLRPSSSNSSLTTTTTGSINLDELDRLRVVLEAYVEMAYKHGLDDPCAEIHGTGLSLGELESLRSRLQRGVEEDQGKSADRHSARTSLSSGECENLRRLLELQVELWAEEELGLKNTAD